MTFDFADIITFTSVFELLFFVIFIFFKSFKQYYNKVLLFFFGFQLLGIVSWILRKYSIYSEISVILSLFELLWAPSLFLYARALTKKGDRPDKYVVYHCIPFLLILIYSLIQRVISLPDIEVYLIVSVQVLAYTLAGLYVLARYHKKVKENFSRDESKIRNWVTVVFLGYALASFAPLIAFYLGIYKDQSSITGEVFAFLPFLIFYNILFFNAIENPVLINELPKNEKYIGSHLTPELALEYLEKLHRIVEKEKLFLEPELTLDCLSQISGISGRYLSQIINQYKQKSFYDYINGLRIQYSCEILTKESRKTILEILYESGFNSKTSFNTSFKKHTGLTPSQYKIKNNIK
ncbi:MAG: helix-turn-helix transcriptional regulator [Bacteroidetes bacterium]|nr:helix-turn-helix transcriptional regulator [Bacteroidota bacterium]MBP1670716.1 helix-turn-helix transcriptional regulator [Bacteroidota bacterium]